MPPPDRSRILVIKLSSLGDFVMALGAFRAIREAHGDDHITLVTTGPYRDLAERCGLFDAVWVDERAPLWQPLRWIPWIRRLRRGGFARVYDLQWSNRSAWYFRLMGPPKPEWVGITPGCSHHYPEARKAVHIMQRHSEMLALAGITSVPAPDLRFLETDLNRFDLPERYALLVPGSSPARLASRWPVERYSALAVHLVERGVTPVLVYGPFERDVAAAIKGACPQACDIEPSLGEIVSLARGAALTVANDTGPMHLIVHAGCPTIVLLSRRYALEKSKPPGRSRALQAETVADITLFDTCGAVDQILDDSDLGGRSER